MVRIVLAMLFIAPMAMGGEKKIFLSGPTKICHPIKCMLIAPGVAHVYETKLGDPSGDVLARGFLAEATEIEGIAVPKGAQIFFHYSSDSDMGIDFEFASNSDQTWADALFYAKTWVKFDRFKRNPKGPGVIPHEDGIVRILGTPNNAARFGTITAAAGQALHFTAKIDGKVLKDAKVEYATVESGRIDAVSPIHLVQGDVIQISHDKVNIVPRRSRVFGPTGLLGRQALLWMDSGNLSTIQLDGTVSCNGQLYQGSLYFHPNGKVSNAEKIFSQKIGSVFMKEGAVTYYDTGVPLSVNSLFVDENAQILPPEFAKLPSILDPHKGHLQFFFDSKGNVAAVKFQGDYELETAVGAAAVSFVKKVGDHLEFTPVPKDKTGLRDAMHASSAFFVSEELTEYFKTGVWKRRP